MQIVLQGPVPEFETETTQVHLLDTPSWWVGFTFMHLMLALSLCFHAFNAGSFAMFQGSPFIIQSPLASDGREGGTAL